MCQRTFWQVDFVRGIVSRQGVKHNFSVSETLSWLLCQEINTGDLMVGTLCEGEDNAVRVILSGALWRGHSVNIIYAKNMCIQAILSDYSI